jgi:hypothetical protein
MNKISRCNICGEFFDSKKALKDHKDKSHRVTDSKSAIRSLVFAAFTSRNKKSMSQGQKK